MVVDAIIHLNIMFELVGHLFRDDVGAKDLVMKSIEIAPNQGYGTSANELGP